MGNNTAKNIGIVESWAKTRILGFMTWVMKKPDKQMFFKNSCSFYIDPATKLPYVMWAGEDGKIWKAQININSIVPDGEIDNS